MKQTHILLFVFIFVLNIGATNAKTFEHLCSRWNVLMDTGFELGPFYGEAWTEGYKLQGDTSINNTQYTCLLFADGHQNQQSDSWEWIYYGALRETDNAEIYFIPAEQSKEYLLFAFNAHMGDKIDNLYVMNNNYTAWAVVKEVTEKEIILDLYEQLDEDREVFRHDYVWIKGIGAKRSMFQPLPNGEVGGCVVNFLLCAYDDETQIYTSDIGDEYGCEYWGRHLAIENISSFSISTGFKVFRDGQLLILRGKKNYNLTGVEIK